MDSQAASGARDVDSQGRDHHCRGCSQARPDGGRHRDWKDTFLLAAENALRSRPKDEEALREEQIKKLERKVGQLVMELDIAREAMKLRPFPEPTSDE